MSKVTKTMNVVCEEILTVLMAEMS